MSKPKFTDDFESNVRTLLRRKSIKSLDQAFEIAATETLYAICKKREQREPVFERMLAYGECELAMHFVEAAHWNDDVAQAVPEMMLPYVRRNAEFQRRQHNEIMRSLRKAA